MCINDIPWGSIIEMFSWILKRLIAVSFAICTIILSFELEVCPRLLGYILYDVLDSCLQLRWCYGLFVQVLGSYVSQVVG